jgi:hypothetical protein
LRDENIGQRESQHDFALREAPLDEQSGIFPVRGNLFQLRDRFESAPDVEFGFVEPIGLRRDSGQHEKCEQFRFVAIRGPIGEGFGFLEIPGEILRLACESCGVSLRQAQFRHGDQHVSLVRCLGQRRLEKFTRPRELVPEFEMGRGGKFGPECRLHARQHSLGNDGHDRFLIGSDRFFTRFLLRRGAPG